MSCGALCRGRHPLFTNITAARQLVSELRHLHERGDVISLARVVMPDHLHWLIQLNERRSLSINRNLWMTDDDETLLVE